MKKISRVKFYRNIEKKSLKMHKLLIYLHVIKVKQRIESLNGTLFQLRDVSDEKRLQESPPLQLNY